MKPHDSLETEGSLAEKYKIVKDLIEAKKVAEDKAGKIIDKISIWSVLLLSYFKFDLNFDFYPSFSVYLFLPPLVSIFIHLNSFAIIRLVFH